jgi:mycoredoxin
MMAPNGCDRPGSITSPVQVGIAAIDCPPAEPTILNVTLEVVFYTRPRCPHSFRLRRALHRRGLPFREVNIWRDAAAAAAVRAVAYGNETVPTVHVGDRWLVNPTADEVCAAAEYQAPNRPRGMGLSRRLLGRD